MTIVMAILGTGWCTGFMTVVIAEHADPVALRGLVLTCSPASLGQRFSLGGSPDPLDIWHRYERFLTAGTVLLARVAGAVPAGVLNLVSEQPGEAEIGVLVADPWQRRGVGTALANALWRRGTLAGWTIHATVRPGNIAAQRFLGSQGFRPVPSFPGDADEYALLVPPLGTVAAGGEGVRDAEDAA